MLQNILLIQSDGRNSKLVRDALTNSRDRSFHVECVRTCARGIQRLSILGKQSAQCTNGISAVLVDLRLPDVVGIDAFDRIFAASPQIPILILSASQDEALAALAVRGGAQDYLLKHRLDDYLLPKALAGVIDRAVIAEALFDEKERAQVTLNSIGDAVICTDVAGRVTYLNVVAERLTGWSRLEAIGSPLDEVVRIIDAISRASVPSHVMVSEVALYAEPTPSCILIRRDGVEIPIEESTAAIRDRLGRMTGAVMVFHDVSAARAVSLKLAHLAQHDGLTNLPNRALLHDRMTHAISCAQRQGNALAVLYIDLDRFKHINDSRGHSVGDRLLQSAALRLARCVRACDTVCRLGGDEFVILLSVSHAEDAALCAAKIRNALTLPFDIDEPALHATASIGIVVYPEDGTDVATLLQNADSAMYEAKKRARNNHQFYRANFNSSALQQQSVAAELRHAIVRNEFELHYQPHIDLASGAITGVEALLRWHHPTLGMVMPTQFIAIAEQCGLIVPIGRWVLREACRQAKAWHDRGLPRVRLAVNISAVELRSEDFVAGIAATLLETNFDPQRLELELTETFLLQDSAATAQVLNDIKALGAHLALDDFGTGYSSLSYRGEFPIDALKIDRSFVRDLTTDADDARMVCAVIDLGRSLRMRVIAEGVESAEQLSFLEQHGCPEAQGFYFSPPLIAVDFAELLRASDPTGLAA